MATTTQDLLNEVLKGLRKDTISTTSVTSIYNLLLLQFVNTAKAQVEDAWDWECLRNTVTVTLAASTIDYALTSSGAADMDVGPRSRLLYSKPMFGAGSLGAYETSIKYAGSLPQVFDTTSTPNEYRLAQITQEKMEWMHFTDQAYTATYPQYFALYRDGTSVRMKVWPTPNDTRTLKMRFVIPQADLASTSIDSTDLTVPSRPVWMKALAFAAKERGEELGVPISTLEEQADKALADSIIPERTQEDDTSYPE